MSAAQPPGEVSSRRAMFGLSHPALVKSLAKIETIPKISMPREKKKWGVSVSAREPAGQEVNSFSRVAEK